MTQSALFDQIVYKLRTKTEVSDVLLCLDEFAKTFFSAKTSEEQQQIFKKLPKEIADVLIAHFATEKITPENQISMTRQIDELAAKLRACQSIQMTIAFQPDDAAIALFSDWIKENIRADLLIDLQFDKSIVGGLLLIADGKYKDYTVRKNLATKFQIQRDDIMGLL